MSSEIDDDTRVAEQAARWFGRLLQGDADKASFFAWLEESPRHVEEFLHVSADAKAMASLTPEQRVSLDQLSGELGWDDVMGANVVPMSRDSLAAYEQTVAEAGTRAPTQSDVGEPPSPRDSAVQPDAPAPGRPRWLIGIAATVMCVIGLTAWLHGPGSWTTYTTKVGEQRALELADGSIIHLNTDSRVAVRLTNTERIVELERGQALFTVQHDPSRPFQVHASEAVIQAIGTQFDVYRQSRGARVAVIEGLVQISRESQPIPAFPAQRTTGSEGSVAPLDTKAAPAAHPPGAGQLLAAGEQAYVSATGTVSARRQVDPVKEVAWRQRRLVFEAEALADIAAEFNRYNSRVKVRVAPAAASFRFSGTFNADAPQDLMKSLADDARLQVEHTGNEIVIERSESRGDDSTK